MTQSPNPYESLPDNAFWRTGVSSKNALSISGLWRPKHALGKNHKISTAGSCFAQHIGKALSRNGYSWHDAEPAPEGFDDQLAKDYNYGIFSFRTGNIYTTAALLQWVTWALDLATPPDEVWEKDGRFYDPFRPAIEPNGFASPDEMFASRQATLKAIRHAIEDTNRFVFTLGLTEAWLNRAGGYTYAMCPGTLAGSYDPELHAFQNYRFVDVLRDLKQAIRHMRAANPALRFLLTVSPVPLTATASGEHVLAATTYSKSVLRAVAGEAAATIQAVDYFPSYEIITAPAFRGMFYEPNLRSVHPAGVDFVMTSFFECLRASRPNNTPSKPVKPVVARQPEQDPDDDLVCEEVMLDSFRRI
jgi:hypothetical protein